MSKEFDAAIEFIGRAYQKDDRDPKFSKKLVELAARACSAIQHLERHEPDEMRNVARSRVNWPSLQYATTEPKSEDSPKPKTEELRRRMESLGLGSELPISVDPKHSDLALCVLDQIASIHSLKKGDEPLEPLIELSVEEIEMGLDYSDKEYLLHEWCLELDKYNLPALSTSTVSDWATVITESILYWPSTYEDAETVKLFGLERPVLLSVPYEVYERANRKLNKAKERSSVAAKKKAEKKRNESATDAIAQTQFELKMKEIRSRKNLDPHLESAARDKVKEILKSLLK